MSKYEGLTRHLSEMDGDLVTLTFSQINDLVTGGLPRSAYDYRPWWANRNDGTGSQNQGWQSVGWESGEVDMDDQTVKFTRVVKKRTDFKSHSYIRPLSIEEAKQGLALMFHVKASSIDITIKG